MFGHLTFDMIRTCTASNVVTLLSPGKCPNCKVPVSAIP